MAERAAAVGGDFTAGAVPPGGFEVLARLLVPSLEPAPETASPSTAPASTAELIR
jgi:hypothetical protein